MADTKWLTQAQYDALSTELRDRTERRRPEIARLIEAARAEGDLKENGGYQAAREDQSMNETRILQLEDILKHSEVGETPDDDGVVEPGMLVSVELMGKKTQFLLGSRDAGANLGVTVYSPEAPLGKALLGASAGETVTYEAPNGTEVSVTILEVTPYRG